MQSFIKCFQWTFYIQVVAYFFKFTGDCAVVGTKGFNLSIGSSSFKHVVDRDMAIVDKSLFIKKIMEHEFQVTLITRPRRFGKSLNLSMLKFFLSNIHETSKLFEKFLISIKEKYFCKAHQNKYPVIHLNFASIKPATYKQSIIALIGVIQEAFTEHRYLQFSDHLSEDEKEMFKRYENGAITEGMTYRAIKTLMIYLHQHHGKKSIVLTDEYDTPLVSAFHYDFYEELIPTLRMLLEITYKDNELLESGVILGITVVGRESLFSSMNNVDTQSIGNRKFSEYFGLLEGEMIELLERLGAYDKNKLEAVKHYYKGYHFGSSTIYNPWSISSYASKKELRGYWSESGSFKEFENLVVKYGALPILKAEMLTNGINIRQTFDNTLVLPDVGRDDDSYWTLMAQLGYVTFTSTNECENEVRFVCDLQIPNHEIWLEFNNVLHSSGNTMEHLPKYEEFLDSIKNNKTDVSSEILTTYLNNSKQFYPGEFPLRISLGLLRGLEKTYNTSFQVIFNDKEHYCAYIGKNCAPNSTCPLMVVNSVQRKDDMKESYMKKFLEKVFEPSLVKTTASMAETAVTHAPKIVVSLYHFSAKIALIS